ncbi:MAG: hypothetical protein IJ489_03645 [Clostridia bacterium]|nr:hypothetical protein [Clostridia bacterium]
MKKIICLLMAIALCVSFASCGSGTSVAIHALRLDNEVENLFLWDKNVASYTETISYKDKDGSEAFSSIYYYEKAEDIYSMYNVCETIGDYKLYAYEGKVYTETEKGITAVLLLSSTYSDFIKGYLSGEFPLDGEVLKQQRSEKVDGKITAYYHTVLTPQQTAKVKSFGFDGTETIETRYVISDEKYIDSVEYTVINGDEKYLFAERKFDIASEKLEGAFDTVASLIPSVSVDIVFVNDANKGRHFEIPAGVYVGIDTADNAYEFFRDEDCTIPYSYEAESVSENIIIYAREKS